MKKIFIIGIVCFSLLACKHENASEKCTDSTKHSVEKTEIKPEIFLNYSEMVASAIKEAEIITIEDFNKKLESGISGILIDVREQEEYAAGHIPGAINIPRGVIEGKLESENFEEVYKVARPGKETAIYLYCKSTNRSPLSAQSLKKLGYNKVTIIEKGFTGWSELYKDKVVK